METIVAAARLRSFVAEAFERCGVPAADAAIAADVLVTSDLRGIESHGVARLHHYISLLRQGLIAAQTQVRMVREMPTALSLDAGSGLGLIAGHQAMQLCIARAREYGSAAVAVHGSTHYGIAGYYAMMALPHDMIGVAMTNASPNVVPFGGLQPMLGTNPLAYAIPCGEEPAIVVDMSTSGVSYGKIELALRAGTLIPPGWAIDGSGQVLTDPVAVSKDRRLLPLGGVEEGVGYKGFGLAMVVEALCHALAGAAMSMQITAVQARGARPNNIGHFFAAYRIDAFRDVDAFKADMDHLVRALRACPPAPGVERVLLPGEKEHLMVQERTRRGVPLHEQVMTSLRTIAAELGIMPL